MNYDGLNNDEVIKSRKKYGSNTIEKSKKNTFFRLVCESLDDPIIKILLIALLVKVIFLFKNFDWYETIGITIAIFLAATISAISEYGSEQAFNTLQEETTKLKTKVKRNKKLTEIIIDEVVVDDLIILEAGDKIPADGILIEGNILVDESLISGESNEIKKKINDKLYRGSNVTSNIGKMKVTNVGINTLYGSIAQELNEKVGDSPLKLRLKKLALLISKIGYTGAFLVFISYLFSVIVINNNYNLNAIKETISNLPIMAEYILYALTLAVTLIVVAVPEGLPMMITLVLSTNMKKMLKEKVLVRKLVGIETAGSINVLLTDKTGTLTYGKLKVDKIICGNLKTFNTEKEILNFNFFYKLIQEAFILNNSATNSNGKIIGGNNTDKALLNFISTSKLDKKIIEQVPFKSENKYSKVILENNIELIKGASEIIIPKCKYYYMPNGEKKILNKNIIFNQVKKYTENSIRVISLAKKEQNEYIFIGLVLIKDQVRNETKNSLALIKDANIQTIMITGDAKETAVSIGKEINLINKSSDIILTSEEFNAFDEEYLMKNFKNIKIIARALPTDKSKLVAIGQKLNLVVGMTGDGLNDAPALKKADVGFAMGSGSEVSKEASDIVILDDNIKSIAQAILYGRTIFKSIRKFIIFQLTVNFCAVILSLIGPYIGINTPVTVIQMLWINMIMDTLAGIAFSFEPALKCYMQEMPKKKDEQIVNKYMINQILINGIYISLICILFLKLPIFTNMVRIDFNDKYLLTAFFGLFIFMNVFNAFNTRTERINILANLFKNKIFLIIFILIISVQIYLIYFGGVLFRTYGLTLKEFLIMFGISVTIIPFDFIRKNILKKQKKIKLGV